MKPGDFIAGKYRLSRLLGEGAMGVVWAANDVRTEAEVALKLIRQAPEISQELRSRLFREARACGRIRHRNVVEVYDVGETSAGQAFLVMQVLHGESLAERLAREGRIAAPSAITIACDIARGLSAAHAVNIVHRDLKPANIFLDRDPEVEGPVVKLVDFGVSKLLGPQDASSTATGSVMGSPAYMSPEQARGAKTIDHRTDVWALGVVIFEMVAGRRPFLGDTAFAVVGEIFTAPIPDLRDLVPGLDPRIAHAVSRCLEREVQQRLGSAAELLAALHPLEGDGSINARQLLPSPRGEMASDAARGSASGLLSESQSQSQSQSEDDRDRERRQSAPMPSDPGQHDLLKDDFSDELTAVQSKAKVSGQAPRSRRPAPLKPVPLDEPPADTTGKRPDPERASRTSSAVTSTTPFIGSSAALSNLAKEHAALSGKGLALGPVRGPTRATALLAVSGAVGIVLLAGIITLVSLRSSDDPPSDAGRASSAAPGGSEVPLAPLPGEGASTSPAVSTSAEIAPTAAAPTESASATAAAVPAESARSPTVPPPSRRPKRPPPRGKPKQGVAIPRDPG